MKNENPICEILKERKWSQKNLGIIVDIAQTTVSSVCNGNANVIPKKMLVALEKLGYSPAKLNSDYTRYRNCLAMEILKEANAS